MEIKQLEAQKKLMLEKYLQFQDIVDGYSDKIYTICCEIEKLNLLIKKEKKKISNTKSKELSSKAVQVIHKKPAEGK